MNTTLITVCQLISRSGNMVQSKLSCRYYHWILRSQLGRRKDGCVKSWSIVKSCIIYLPSTPKQPNSYIHEPIKLSSAELFVDPSLTYRSPRRIAECPRTYNQGLGGLGAGGPLFEFSPKKCCHTPSVCSANWAMHLVSVLDHRWDCPCIHPFKMLREVKQCALKTYTLRI